MPASIGMCSQIFVEVINLAFVGHQGKNTMIAGVGLGNMYINTVALSVFYGLNNAVATLVS
jgi:Na+-driven multidrug efflux pump